MVFFTSCLAQKGLNPVDKAKEAAQGFTRIRIRTGQADTSEGDSRVRPLEKPKWKLLT